VTGYIVSSLQLVRIQETGLPSPALAERKCGLWCGIPCCFGGDAPALPQPLTHATHAFVFARRLNPPIRCTLLGPACRRPNEERREKWTWLNWLRRSTGRGNTVVLCIDGAPGVRKDYDVLLYSVRSLICEELAVVPGPSERAKTGESLSDEVIRRSQWRLPNFCAKLSEPRNQAN
jgi:hypothetical protein